MSWGGRAAPGYQAGRVLRRVQADGHPVLAARIPAGEAIAAGPDLPAPPPHLPRAHRRQPLPEASLPRALPLPGTVRGRR